MKQIRIIINHIKSLVKVIKMRKMNSYKLLSDIKRLLTSFPITPLHDQDKQHVHHLNHFLQMKDVHVLQNKGAHS